MSLITGQIWKIATGGAAVLALVLSALLLSTYFENRDLSRQRDELAREINDPKTGYVAKLAQANTNVAQLQIALDAQNQKFRKLSADSEAELAETARRLAVAQSETRRMEQKLAGFLATGPQGTTLEDRIRDIDKRAMSEFLP